MSAAPYITVREQYTQTKRKPAPRPRPTEAASVAVKPRRKAKAGMNAIEFAVSQVVTFTVVAAIVFGFSVLMGSSFNEIARRQTAAATTRARAAETDIVRLRDRLDRLSNASVVGDWAKTRGFVPAYGKGVEEVGTL
ncbi:MAG: hypothetical protein KF824_01075 [Fimbriimonadaceae bacterium]|nr:MAG: hypothetical protein KF824_01075 [Fimbriimonadaceae bacterium]